MKTAVYMRCSTDRQSTESQRHALTEWVEANAPDATWFTDEGMSGANDNRPAWQECYRRCKEGEFGRLVVWKKDRIGRGFKSRLYWTYALDQFGVEVVSLTEDDSGNELVDAIMDVISAFHAKEERRLIQERTKAGIRAARAKGEPWGGARCIKPDTKGFRKFTDDEEAEIAASVKGGEPITRAADRLGVSYRTVRRVLRRVEERRGSA